VKVDHGKVLGPVVVREDTRFHGMIDGGVTVAPGVTLDMRGMIAGDLTIEPDARVELRGMVAGSVVNKGHLKIYGVVRGRVTDKDEGETEYESAVLGERDRD
jgi:cytoskeletal protein CcmA (bactofilin family)